MAFLQNGLYMEETLYSACAMVRDPSWPHGLSRRFFSTEFRQWRALMRSNHDPHLQTHHLTPSSPENLCPVALMPMLSHFRQFRRQAVLLTPASHADKHILTTCGAGTGQALLRYMLTAAVYKLSCDLPRRSFIVFFRVTKSSLFLSASSRTAEV